MDVMHPVLRKLEGADLRSIGRSNEVVADVIANPRLFGIVFSGLQSDNALLRARAADAVEQITARHPEYLRQYRKVLIGPLAHCDQKEVRWHVAQMLPRIRWNAIEQKRVLDILMAYLNDRSSIVKTCAMQALADLARQTPEWVPAVRSQLQQLIAVGTAAMKARGRKLLSELSEPTGAQAGMPKSSRLT
jgi:hypothetical protein